MLACDLILFLAIAGFIHSCRYKLREYSLLPIHWNDATQMLIFGERTGKFAGWTTTGRLESHWWVREHGAGELASKVPDAMVGSCLDDLLPLE